MATTVGRGRGVGRTVALLSTGQLVAWGVLFYAFGALLPSMRAELTWSTATISAGFSVGLLTSALLAPRVGEMIDDRGSRRLMTIGSLTGALGVAGWALAPNPVLYLAAWAVIGVGMATTLYEPAVAILVREHPTHRRGAILAVTLIAALAAPLFVPASTWTAHRFGWRPTALVLSLLMAATALLHVQLPATLPRPRHGPAIGTGTPARPSGAAPLGTLTTAFAISAGVLTAVTAHGVAMLIEVGHSAATAATLMGAVGLAKMPGRIAVAALVDRWNHHKLLAILLAVQAVGLAAAVGPRPLAWAMPLLLGSSAGALTIARPLVLAPLTGINTFASHSGRMQRAATLAKAAGPFGLGLAASTISYLTSWIALAVLLLLSAAAAWQNSTVHGARRYSIARKRAPERASGQTAPPCPEPWQPGDRDSGREPPPP